MRNASEKARSIREKVDKMSDGINMPVDEGIKQSVVAFLINVFPTAMSCEGHLTHGQPYPWILVEHDYPKDFDSASAKAKQQYKKRNISDKQRMKILLSNYYKNRKTAYELGIWEQGIYGAFRVQPVKDVSEIRPSELAGYQAEMTDFTDYLIDNANKGGVPNTE